MVQPSTFVIILPDHDSDDIDPMSLPSMINRHVSLGLAPVTGIYVGAIALTSRGIFLGINIELPGVHESHSIHALQFLVTNLILNSETSIRYLAVNISGGSNFYSPCSHCHRFLEEFYNADNIKVLKTNNIKENNYVNLGSILNLLHVNFRFPDSYRPLFIHARFNGLSFLNPDPHGICVDVDCGNLKCRALTAANKSYAPYSNCPSGVALRDCDGKVYKGWFLESPSVMTSLGPLQVALVDFVTRSQGKGFDKIVQAVLVEKKDGSERQEDMARKILQNIAHRCTFDVFHCH